MFVRAALLPREMVTSLREVKVGDKEPSALTTN